MFIEKKHFKDKKFMERAKKFISIDFLNAIEMF